MSFRSAAAQAFTGNAYLLMVLTTLCWGGNAVASRLAVGQISPMLLTAGRWGLVLLILAIAAGRTIAAHRAELAARWRTFLALGVCGFTAFNSLFYVAAHMTSAVNLALLQGAIPAFVLFGGLAAHRTAIRPGQVLGLAVTLAGVLTVAVGGDIAGLARLRFNPGDILMLGACALYAGYTLALRGREGATTLWFFAGLATAAFVSSIPLALGEIALGQAQWPTALGWMILTFIALAPSFLAQVCYLRAVALIGPARAGLFINLVPVFGALMAVVVLGEPFHLHHAVALGLVLAGILASELSAPR